MFTVGPRIMSRPSAFTSCAIAWPSRCTRSVSHVAAMATPEGNDVVSTFTGALAALVIAELPAHDRTPMGPSAILIAGIPSRSMGADSIQPDPESMVAFSSRVMRFSRSATRCSDRQACDSCTARLWEPGSNALRERCAGSRNQSTRQQNDTAHRNRGTKCAWAELLGQGISPLEIRRQY